MLPRVAWLDEWSGQLVCMMWFLIPCWPEHDLLSDWERERESGSKDDFLPVILIWPPVWHCCVLCLFVQRTSWPLHCCYFMCCPMFTWLLPFKGHLCFPVLSFWDLCTGQFLIDSQETNNGHCPCISLWKDSGLSLCVRNSKLIHKPLFQNCHDPVFERSIAC